MFLRNGCEPGVVAFLKFQAEVSHGNPIRVRFSQKHSLLVSGETKSMFLGSDLFQVT